MLGFFVGGGPAWDRYILYIYIPIFYIHTYIPVPQKPAGFLTLASGTTGSVWLPYLGTRALAVPAGYDEMLGLGGQVEDGSASNQGLRKPWLNLTFLVLCCLVLYFMCRFQVFSTRCGLKHALFLLLTWRIWTTWRIPTFEVSSSGPSGFVNYMSTPQNISDWKKKNLEKKTANRNPSFLNPPWNGWCTSNYKKTGAQQKVWGHSSEAASLHLSTKSASK